jgi:hypothetical protein
MPFLPQFSNLFVPPFFPAPPPSTGAYAWYKADVGVTQSGGTVSQWNDQSGNGRNLTVPSGKNGPNYVSSGINSLPSIEFSSTAHALQLTGNTTTIKTIVSVVRSADVLDTYQCIVEASGGGLYTVLDPDGPRWGSYWADFVYYSAISADTNYILSVRIDPSFTSGGGGNTYGYLNGTSYTAAGAGFQPRDNITVGTDSTFGQPIQGLISELILFDAILSNSEILSYIGDMNSKYLIY